MIKKDSALYKKLATAHAPTCPICNKSVYLYDYNDLEYVKTKRKGELFIHTNCILKGVNHD